jgi:hypothetical protein
VFGFTAHAYRFFSTAFSHDSTYLYHDMAAWQISIGRFLQPYTYCCEANYAYLPDWPILAFYGFPPE